MKARTLFATHYHELTELELTRAGVRNYNVAVREWNDQIIFLRKIVKGGADKSYGIQVARLAGLPPRSSRAPRKSSATSSSTNSTPTANPRSPRPRPAETRQAARQKSRAEGARRDEAANVAAVISRAALIFALAIAAPFIGASLRGDDDLSKFAFEKAEMGVPFRITLYAPDEATAKRTADAGFARVAALNHIFSDYEDDSELTRLSRTSGQGRAVKVSDDLWTVLSRAQVARGADGGRL